VNAEDQSAAREKARLEKIAATAINNRAHFAPLAPSTAPREMNGAPDALIGAQRQMFPVIALSMSHRLGRGFSRSRTAALISCPDWQSPHCGTSRNPSALQWMTQIGREGPSMVVLLCRCRDNGADAGSHASPIRVHGTSGRTAPYRNRTSSFETEIFPQHQSKGSCRIHVRFTLCLFTLKEIIGTPR